MALARRLNIRAMPFRAAMISRHFLGWDRPLPELAVAWLANGWDGRAPLDLSRLVVLVPTRQSGRRLREALAAHAATRRQAVFPPRVLTPDAFVGAEPGAGVASRIEALQAWAGVFREMERESFAAVFPTEPPARNFPWALRLAEQFTRLQSALAENGLRLREVAERAGGDFVEAERWQQLGELEACFEAALAARGLVSSQAARFDVAGCDWDDLAVERFVLVGVPDAQPLALTRLERVAATRPVDVLVFAPASESEAFDAWGRPRPEAWETRPIALEPFEERVFLCADPAAQAAQIARLAARYPQADGCLAVGVTDPEVVPLLEAELARAGGAAFDPEGRRLREEALYQLLSCLAALARDPAFAAVEALARCPGFFSYLRTRGDARFSVARWLEGLDELRARHLPADLAAAAGFAGRLKRFPELRAGLDAMRELRETLTRFDFARGAAEVLRELFAGRQLDLARDEDVRLQAAAASWTEVLRDCARAAERFGELVPADGWDLALRVFGELRLGEEKPAGAIELQGWLELLWDDAPHLAVAGFNDGRVPEAVVEDAFLPESLRAQLGLRTNAMRFARDAYLFTALLGSRARRGRVDVFFGKTSSIGDPLRPSRLLLRCADELLPERIRFLFRAADAGEATAPWQRAWKLNPRHAPPPESVAVTALRRYLACPFRFYLRTVLRMESVDPYKSELDAMDFGTLCHAALEQIGREAGLRDCTDPTVLRTELLHRLDSAVRQRFGAHLSLPLVVQVESARQRLARLAELQAAERAAGWEIVDVEREFAIDVAGLTVRGKIDRIDRHAATGAIRVLDYKTSDTPVTPAEAHLRAARPGETAPEWARLEFDGKPRVWVDLQLPMYLRALAAEFPGRPQCGYFNLPKATGETTLSLWESYPPELHASAMHCAESAARAIRAGEFWPPNEDIRAERDECAALFHRGAGESVAWEEGRA